MSALLTVTACPSAYGPLEEDANSSSSSSSTTSTPPECGDGILQAPEECDDGNLDDNDSCTHLCTNTICGDNIISPGETCDDGNADNTDACTDTCQAASCGDAIVQSGEDCDLGAQNGSFNSCTISCTTAICGDGMIWYDGNEQCDDGSWNDNNGSCTLGCTTAICGDGYIHAANETCENNENVEGEPVACREDCTYCGDGFLDLQNGEECDGELSKNGPCLLGCKMATCGDGVVHRGVESCDDGNIDNTDSCSWECEYTRRTVFVTSSLPNGGFSGYTGATSDCQSLAQSVGLPNAITFKAWVSDKTNWPAKRFDTAYEGHYVRSDGKIIARGWADLTDGTLDYPINVDEMGSVEDNTEFVWTGTSPQGFPLNGTNCAYFTSADPNQTGRTGRLTAKDQSWSDDNLTLPCNVSAAIYCFEDLP